MLAAADIEQVQARARLVALGVFDEIDGNQTRKGKPASLCTFLVAKGM